MDWVRKASYLAGITIYLCCRFLFYPKSLYFHVCAMLQWTLTSAGLLSHHNIINYKSFKKKKHLVKHSPWQEHSFKCSQ